VTIRDFVIKVLRKVGGALAGTVHDRMSYGEGILVRLESHAESLGPQLRELSSQNQHLAEAHTALLQASIETVESLRKLQKPPSGQMEAQVRLETLSREVRAELAKLVRESDRAAGSQALFESLLNDMDRSNASRAEQLEAGLQKIENAHARQIEYLQAVLESNTSGLKNEILELKNGIPELKSGILELKNGIPELKNGILELKNGIPELKNGTLELRSHISQLTNHLSDFRSHINSVLENEFVQQVCVETNDYALTNPEIGLLSFLYSYLPTRCVIDIGAHMGDVSEALLSTGYEVYAFEPSPAIYERLVERLGGRNGFHPLQLALGSNEGDMPLHSAVDTTSSNTYGDATVFSSLITHGMPEGLRFNDTITVPVRTLQSLHAGGLVPELIGLVKIDTEGFDLEVIRGMGEYRYPVVTVEYWDSEIPFGRLGLLYTLGSMVAEMRSRGYLWHLVLYRIWGRNQMGFYCNHDRSLPNSWGNIFFFRDYDLFARAQTWCEAVLPRIYFKPAAATGVATATH
jgi:FkbM family methyltransferase